MLTIGAFSQLGGVSVRALRHYEAVGVLLPSWIDPATGYRRYRADQLARLHRIQALQDLGLSLQQLRPLLDDGPSAAQLSGMLVLKRAELAHRVAEDQERLARVERRLRYIELEDDMSIDYVIKRIPAVRVAQVRYAGEEGLDFYTLRDFAREAGETLQRAMQSAAAEPAGHGFMHYEDRPDGTLTPILAVPIAEQDSVDASGVEVTELPEITAVVTIFRGAASHDLVGPIYGQMARYAEDHGYVMQGAGRDHLLSHESPENMVLELQLPVTRAPSD
jgi:DNA-binding transcriptional MerR regulator